jgi:hypothetical protein
LYCIVCIAYRHHHYHYHCAAATTSASDKSRGEGFAALDSKEVWSNVHIPSVIVRKGDADVLLRHLMPEEDKEL